MDANFRDFLNTCLGPGDYKVIQLAGDASARRYYRAALGERTWVLMSWEPFKAKDYPFLSVQALFKDCKVSVPEVVGLSEAKGLLLLEDLGDLTLERKFWENQDPSSSLRFYHQALEELNKIHFETKNSKVDSTAHHLNFDTAKFKWEFNYSKEHLLEGLGQLKMTPAQLQVVESTAHEISQRLDREPKWICHRDYHSRNLMIKLDRVRVIDFQDARGGPIQYDLVSLLRDSYVGMSDQMITELMNDFWVIAKPKLGKEPSFEYFQLMFELQTIQRCFKACGSFASFWNQRQDTRYLKYIYPTLKRVQRALSHFPEYKDFALFLLDSGLPEKKFE
jgi:aminoglycoside/choline kinase family phosphotransferase